MENIIKFIGVLFISALASSSAYAQFSYYEYIDDATISTVGKKMHVCPTGHMSGFHKHHNDLLCYTSGVISNVAFSEDDYNTTRSGMHACPEGTAMVGIHVDHNVLKCAGAGIIVSSSEYISYGGAGSLRYGMHACPEGWIMTGIHVVGNRFLCSWLNH